MNEKTKTKILSILNKDDFFIYDYNQNFGMLYKEKNVSQCPYYCIRLNVGSVSIGKMVKSFEGRMMFVPFLSIKSVETLQVALDIIKNNYIK